MQNDTQVYIYDLWNGPKLSLMHWSDAWDKIKLGKWHDLSTENIVTSVNSVYTLRPFILSCSGSIAEPRKKSYKMKNDHPQRHFNAILAFKWWPQFVMINPAWNPINSQVLRNPIFGSQLIKNQLGIFSNCIFYFQKVTFQLLIIGWCEIWCAKKLRPTGKGLSIRNQVIIRNDTELVQKLKLIHLDFHMRKLQLEINMILWSTSCTCGFF